MLFGRRSELDERKIWAFEGMNVRGRRVLRKMRRRNKKELMKYGEQIDKNNIWIKNEKINLNELTKKEPNGRNVGKKKQLL